MQLTNRYSFFQFKKNGAQNIGVSLASELYSLPVDLDIIDLALNPKLVKSEYLTEKDKLDINQIEFLSPIINPSKIICVGLNYDDHVQELNRQALGYPTFFSRFNHSYVPHRHNIPITNLSDKYDYEGELAIIIGKAAYKVMEQDAKNYICGYSIFNDVTVRDYQARTSQWFLGKNFNQTGAFGPYLVPAIYLPENAIGLNLVTKVNNIILQSANTSDMLFKPYELVSILSEVMQLEPGDVIITGTPGGVAVSRTPRTYLKNGDICQISIDGLGCLENKMQSVFSDHESKYQFNI